MRKPLSTKKRSTPVQPNAEIGLSLSGVPYRLKCQRNTSEMATALNRSRPKILLSLRTLKGYFLKQLFTKNDDKAVARLLLHDNLIKKLSPVIHSENINAFRLVTQINLSCFILSLGFVNQLTDHIVNFNRCQ